MKPGRLIKLDTAPDLTAITTKLDRVIAGQYLANDRITALEARLDRRRLSRADLSRPGFDSGRFLCVLW